MEGSLALLRCFGLLLFVLALAGGYFVTHLGRATAGAAASAAARAVASRLPTDWDCQLDGGLATQLRERATEAASARLRQLSALTLAEATVDVGPDCSVVVGTAVSVNGAPWPVVARAVRCAHRPTATAVLSAALRSC